MKTQLLVKVHGTSKNYYDLYVYSRSLGMWVESTFPYWAQRMTRKDLKEWLKGKFFDDDIKIIFSK